jgi:type IV secretory pathway VirB3-like protein
MTEKLTDKEKKISAIAIWVWRNLLASGIILVCFGFLYNKCEQIEDNVIEVSTVLKERIRVERGDYGWQSASYSEVAITPEKMKEGTQVREHISNFADK